MSGSDVSEVPPGLPECGDYYCGWCGCGDKEYDRFVAAWRDNQRLRAALRATLNAMRDMVPYIPEDGDLERDIMEASDDAANLARAALAASEATA